MPFTKLRQAPQSRLLPFYLLVTLLVISSVNFFFFWDKDILNARQGLFYLQHGFSWLAPPDMDSGHPPVMGWLLGGLWKMFGLHLAVGHLAMLPFALGLVWQLYRFIAFFLPEKSRYLVLLLVLIDTSLLSQMLILTGELILLFLLFLAINSVLNKKYLLLIIASVFLGLSSSRGTMSCMAIVMFHAYLVIREQKLSGFIRYIPRLTLLYLPALLITSAYLLYHYRASGWIGYDPDGEHWVQLFQKAGWAGGFKNCLIILWRLVDFGRIFLYFAGLFFLIVLGRMKWKVDDKIMTLLVLLLLCLLVYTPSMIVYTGLLSHRYIIPVFMIFSVLIGYILFEKMDRPRLMRNIYLILILGLITGNFWVYPDSVAKGWDASLAHIPYYKLRNEMIDYLDKENIPFSEVGTEVPNNAPLRVIDLSDDPRTFPYKDMATQQYIFYSNIYNMFTDTELKELEEDWLKIKELRLLQVRVALYKKQ